METIALAALAVVDEPAADRGRWPQLAAELRGTPAW
jgi:hypothetical protein